MMTLEQPEHDGSGSFPAPGIILIHPPVSKPAEAPAGLAKLAGCLQTNSIPFKIIDANLEGILFLLKAAAQKNDPSDRWTMRARKHLEANLAAVKGWTIYQNRSRYQRVVHDLNRLLWSAGIPQGIDLTLADYRDRHLSPVKSSDLLYAAENYRLNPFYPYFSARLEKALELNPEYIGFSLNYLSQALCTFAMIGFIKKIDPGRKIILGGSLTTSWLKIMNGNNFFRGLVDILVEGPGEKKLLDLLSRKDGATDTAPRYGDLPLSEYFSPATVLPYSSARGCYWHQCSFCPEKAEGNEYQPQTVRTAMSQLNELCRQIKPGLIHLVDNAISPALLNSLAGNSPGAPWFGFTRVTNHLTDIDFCRSLQQNGCVMLKLGIESGDQDVLNELNKGIDLETVSKALKAIRQAGIATYVYLLFGTPPENEERAGKTLDFVIQHQDCIDFLNLAIFNLPVLSDESRSLITRSFYEGDLSLYRDFDHPSGWQRKDVRLFLEKTFKKNPAVAEILKRTPEYFTSNHAPFFVGNTVLRLHRT